MRAEVVAKGWILVAVGHRQDLFRMGKGLFVLDLLDTIGGNVLQKLGCRVTCEILCFTADLINILVFLG